MTKENEQIAFDIDKSTADDESVVCLGMTFKNDDERREYFRNELRKKLSELKEIEGFPIGEDEDIVALSDPPYYTACPNPWINDFIEEWEREKAKLQASKMQGEKYTRKPFSSDISEGKGNSIYNAHSYHTKVPHRAIIRYILHYTNPGDIILDGFSGSGMTGIASQLVNSENELKELGFFIDNEKVYNNDGIKIGHKGVRHCILNDLSTAASFISFGYNYPEEKMKLTNIGMKILKTVKNKYKWMLETDHDDNTKGEIKHVLWSDIYSCPECAQEINFWTHGIDHTLKKNKEQIDCPNCDSKLNKRYLERVFISKKDTQMEEVISIAKQVPVLISYTLSGKSYTKKPDQKDIEKISKIENMKVENQIPTDKLPKGYNTNQPMRSHGIKRVHHFYTKRNLILLSEIYKHCETPGLKFIFTGLLTRSSKQARFLTNNYFHGGGGWVGTSLSGTLFVPSLSVEVNPLFTFENRLKRPLNYNKENNNIISTQASQHITQLKNNSIDYIFTDPPFGSNLMYSELNFNMESWLGVQTNNKPEAIVNEVLNRKLPDYQELMEACFNEYFRVLKPNRWITVEFSNSQSSVWNAIQEAIQRAGFIIANVTALDKKQGSFKAVTSMTAVKQDLIISAYKPKEETIDLIMKFQNTRKSAWTFVIQHLEQLPVFMGSKGNAEMISERTPRILFDRMVAYHVQNGLPVPISSAEFQEGIAQRFPMRDGMAFLESQVAEYDKKRILVKEFSQQSLFVSDENSAIEWIRQQLMKKPQTRQDLHPNFMKEIQHIAKHELLPELDDLLNQNFLMYEGDGVVPDQIVSYLRRNYKDVRGLDPSDSKVIEKAMNCWYVPDPTKQADLEKLRERALLREFDGYLAELEGNKRKLRQFRTEAIRAGFKKAYTDKDFEKIVRVGDRLPEKIIQEDDKLLMFYDNASMLLG